MNKIYLILALLIPSTAFAYFDIGTGTYLFQVAIASFFGVLYTTRTYISALFRKLFRKSELKKSTTKDNNNAL